MPAEAHAATFRRPAAPTLGDARRLLGEVLSTRDESSWPEPPSGDRRPAALVPGFLAGDASLSRMARWLRSGDWVTARSGIRLNVGCMETAVRALESRLEETVEKAGRPALLVGQSRGGTFARVLALRRPDLIETLLTLGSPVLDQTAVGNGTRAVVTLIGALGTAGMPGLFSLSCRDGDCCEAASRQLTEPLSDGVRYIAFYSRRDPIVSWEACLDPGAELVEVDGTHSGMGTNRDVWIRMAELLES